jgi:hypothetical protein
MPLFSNQLSLPEFYLTDRHVVLQEHVAAQEPRSLVVVSLNEPPTSHDTTQHSTADARVRCPFRLKCQRRGRRF